MQGMTTSNLFVHHRNHHPTSTARQRRETATKECITTGSAATPQPTIVTRLLPQGSTVATRRSHFCSHKLLFFVVRTNVHTGIVTNVRYRHNISQHCHPPIRASIGLIVVEKQFPISHQLDVVLTFSPSIIFMNSVLQNLSASSKVRPIPYKQTTSSTSSQNFKNPTHKPTPTFRKRPY